MVTDNLHGVPGLDEAGDAPQGPSALPDHSHQRWVKERAVAEFHILQGDHTQCPGMLSMHFLR